MGKYIFSNYELAIAIAVVYFDYYVNLWYNKDVTKIGFLKKGGKNMKKLTIETKKRMLLGALILLIIGNAMLLVATLLHKNIEQEEVNPEQEAYEYLLQNGDLSPEQSIGIVANIRQQSNFDTSVHDDGTFHSTGLLCWTMTREEQLSEFAEEKGEEVTNFYLQLDFILEELKDSSEYANFQLVNYHGYTVEDWNKVQSPEEAALAFAYLYVRPGHLNETTLRDLAAELSAEVPHFSKGSQVL